MGTQRPLRILCAREQQNSIADSVHKLLSDQIDKLGLGQFYEIQKQYIHGANGTQFSFEGLRHNISRIKSYEGIDICWVEEAEATSNASLEVLIPTIRKDDSEIWFSFNPRLKEDPIYRRFVLDPPDDTILVRMSWRDNPWFPETLRKEMETLKAKNFDAYLNVWEGECVTNLNGAVYAEEIRRCVEENRVTKVPYDATVSVDVFVDLGRRDATTLLFVQRVGFEYHIIDHYSTNLKFWGHYMEELQKRKYIYNTVYLPWDAKAKTVGTKMSIEELTREAGFRVRVVPRLAISDGINAARTIFDRCWFDEKKTKDFFHNLRQYHYETERDNKGLLKNEPVHDESSHDADTFRYFAVMSKPPKAKGQKEDSRFGNIDPISGEPVQLRARFAPLIKAATTGWMR
jgi:phage terminase large subunit